MDISLYTLNKRINSTARPAGEGTVYSGKLREGCDTLSPVIGLNLGHNTTPAGYNYCYIAVFGRFYWISNWHWEAGLWWCECKVDALASWRDYILPSQQYVLRSSDLFDGSIPDALYPAKTEPDSASILVSVPWAGATNPANGYYIVGIVNYDSSAIGATSYYVFNNAGFRTLMRGLLSDVTWTGFTDGDSDLTESVYKSLFNPMQYVVSAMYCPLLPPTGGAVNSVPVGWWSVNAPAWRLGGTVLQTTTNVDLSNVHHPQAATRGKYLDAEPYSRLSISIPPFGKFPLSALNCLDKGSITIFTTIDVVSGIGELSITSYDREVVTSCQFCVPVQLAQVTQNFTGAASAVLDAAGGAVKGAIAGAATGGAAGAVGGVIMGAGSGIISAVDCLMPRVQTAGVNGSFSGFRGCTVDYLWLDIVAEDRGNLGRPLCAPVHLSDLAAGAYVKIAEPDVSVPCTEEEQAEIRAFMAGGMFLDRPAG